MRYRFIEHTADVEFVAYGETIEQLFVNALTAMFDTVADIKKLKNLKEQKRKLELFEKAPELEDLLWFSLQDALSLIDSNGLQGFSVDSLKIRKNGPDYVLAAWLEGRKKNQKLAKLDVKGVSRFDMHIELGRKGYTATVVLDV
jgi:SHS2 domain-containing protein